MFIKLVKEKKTKALPARAGLIQLAPSPPKVHLTTKMAKAAATMGTTMAVSTLKFIPIKRPVRKADPSARVEAPRFKLRRYSTPIEVAIETTSSKRARHPKR